MEPFIEIAKVHDLPIGRVRTYTVGNRKIALYHTARGFFASDNTCPHRGGPLGEGDLIGDEIICPWHLWGFDTVTGICTGDPEMSVLTHEVKIERDRVMIRLSPPRAGTELS